ERFQCLLHLWVRTGQLVQDAGYGGLRVVVRAVPGVVGVALQRDPGGIGLDHRVGGETVDVLIQIGGAPGQRVQEQPIAAPVVDREVVPDVQVLGAVGLRGRTDRLHGDLVGEDAFTGPLHTDVVVDALPELRLVGVFLGAVVVGRDGLQGGQ